MRPPGYHVNENIASIATAILLSGQTRKASYVGCTTSQAQRAGVAHGHRRTQTDAPARSNLHVVAARWKRVERVLLVDDFPRNAAGKTLKREMRAAFWEGKGRAV